MPRLSESYRQKGQSGTPTPQPASAGFLFSRGKMSSRDVKDLRDDIRFKALAHIDCCKREGVDLLIYCTLRSNEEQDDLYAIGRNKPGKIVTNARRGQSAHNPQKDGKALAYDCCPLRHGKPVWGSSSKEDASMWAIVGRCGEEVGLVWSGRWTGKLKELAHFQADYFVKGM